VALLSNGKMYCTGVLVTPTVVATAAHCVLPSPPEQIYFGSRPGSKSGTLIAVSDTRAHPDFDEDTLQNDIAVVGLAARAPAAPLGVITKPLDASDRGRPLRVVGFGAPAASEITDLRKRTGATTIDSIGDDDFRFHPSPSGTCVGDSGGPALVTIDGHEAVIGITSSGDSECRVYGRDMRMDRYVPFIRGYATAYSLPPAPDRNQGCSAARATTGAPGPSPGVLVVAGVAVVVALRRRRHPLSASFIRSSMR
jgi:MYXO-CTERM domain-containing protein